MGDYAYVYILANGYKKLYIGVTTTLAARIRQHKDCVNPQSHTARYNIDQLVHFEIFTTVTAAIAREKQLKGWLRIRKVELIISTNPGWRDLSADWGQPILPGPGVEVVGQQRTTTKTGILPHSAALRVRMTTET
ncbi:GIY-YIG nuclease family protein [Tunturiibacter lichenicola]|uniref:GIY-YIG nuclease family protein n=1 Tax=Tunturiibacter lichenicola TaxID=2051959 RepID=UPI003D9B69A0